MIEQSKGNRRIPIVRKEAKKAFPLPAPSPSTSTLREVHKLFDRYSDEVSQSDLSQSSKTMYIDFADCFVRWMNGGFQPGLRPRGKRTSNIV